MRGDGTPLAERGTRSRLPQLRRRWDRPRGHDQLTDNVEIWLDVPRSIFGNLLAARGPEGAHTIQDRRSRKPRSRARPEVRYSFRGSTDSSGAFDARFDASAAPFLPCRTRIGGRRGERMCQSQANLVARQRFKQGSGDDVCRTDHASGEGDHAERTRPDRLFLRCWFSPLCDRCERLESRPAGVESALRLFTRRAEGCQRRS